MSLNKLFIRILQSLSTIVVLMVFLILAGLSEHFYASWDWTENQKNSLSPRSEQILRKLDGPVEIIVAYSQRAEDGGVKGQLEKIVEQYVKVKDDVLIQYINSTLDPQTAQELGVSNEIELRLKYSGRSRTVTEISENEISNSLLRMMLDDQARVYWLEYGRSEILSDQKPEGLKLFADSLKEDGIDLETINLLNTADLHENDPQLLIIASPPSRLLDEEIKRIDQYILAGGNALFLIEPGQSFGLENLLTDHGVKLAPGVLLDITGAIFMGSQLFVMVQEFPDHPTLSRLERPLVFPRTGSVDYTSLTDADGWQREFLLRSSANTKFQLFDEDQAQSADSSGANRPVALVMTRPLDQAAETQAVREGLSLASPAAANESDDGEPEDADDVETSIDDLLNVNRDEQRLIVVANTNFIRNQYIGTGNNLSFARDAVNWLASNDQLLTITREKAGDRELNLDENYLIWVSVFWAIIAPILILLIGAAVVFWRRNLNQRRINND